MADNRNGCAAPNSFSEAVCIDAGRIYDSCCEQQLPLCQKKI